MTATPTLSNVDLYRQVVAIKDEDPAITPEEQATFERAFSAWQSAREQVDVAMRSRKDKDQRVAEAQALLDVTTEAYKAAQVPQSKAETAINKRAYAVAELLWQRIAEQAFGGKVRFVNSYPTGEKRSEYGMEREVYRVRVEDTYDQDAAILRGFEVDDLPFRIIPRQNIATDLSFEVTALTDETFEDDPTVRKSRFGYSADVHFRSERYTGDATVEVGWGGGSSKPVADAVLLVEVYNLALRVAHIVEDIAKEVSAK